jgi:hypothetical protein
MAKSVSSDNKMIAKIVAAAFGSTFSAVERPVQISCHAQLGTSPGGCGASYARRMSFRHGPETAPGDAQRRTMDRINAPTGEEHAVFSRSGAPRAARPGPPPPLWKLARPTGAATRLRRGATVVVLQNPAQLLVAADLFCRELLERLRRQHHRQRLVA